MSGDLWVSRGRRVAAAAALAIGLTACGGSSTSPSSGAASTAQSPPSSDAASEASSPTATSADESEWLALDMKVRVVNLWHPVDSTTGGAVDVYSEIAQDGKKLMTVAPGTVSELVVPYMKKLVAGEGEKTFNLSFYPEGKTVRDDELIYQGETSASGLVLTYVLLPPSPDSDGGSSIQVFADETGSSTDWSTSLVGTPPAGKAALMLNATALQYAGKDPNDYPTYLASTTAGKCIGYLDGDGTEHTDTSSFSLIGGTSGMTVVLDQGEQIRINKTGPTSEGVDKVCASKPVVPATDTGLTAGRRAYGFLYGTDPSAPQLLLVPIG
ncbi:hypothetical protein GCM10009810_10140 [Nostocoides vanveenii]|uniref:Uncharacterized protein n=2 Tax=Nostocoides vanveenii TaxID=330835 RepID=A0ABP4WG52_9MICO